MALVALAAVSGCGLVGSSSLPTEGIVATAGGGRDQVGGSDRLSGRLSLDKGCVVVTTSAGREIVPVFRTGAAEVDGDLTKLSWNGREYREGSRISLVGDAVGAFSGLPGWTDYFVPGGCMRFDRVVLVNYFGRD